MSGVQVSAGASDPSAVVVPTPPHQQQRQEVNVTQLSQESIDEIIRRYKAFPKSESEQLDEGRGWLMVLATLTASVTYSAALNPPGGVWQADDATNGYVAGNPVFRDKSHFRYLMFTSCNITSFASSVYIIVVLSIPKLFNRNKMKMCNIIVVFDIIALMGALVAGSASRKTDFVFSGALLVCVLIHMITIRVQQWLTQIA